jgi:hypothetical protein
MCGSPQEKQQGAMRIRDPGGTRATFEAGIDPADQIKRMMMASY